MKRIHQVETVLAGELDTLKLSTLRMMLSKKIKMLGTLDDKIAASEDEGALAEDIEQSDEYKQKILIRHHRQGDLPGYAHTPPLFLPPLPRSTCPCWFW